MRVRSIKLLLVISLSIPSVSWGVNVTQSQVQDVQKKATDIHLKALQMLQYANYANSLFTDNFEMKVFFSTNTVSMPTSLKNEVINISVYQNLKVQLQALVDSLP